MCSKAQALLKKNALYEKINIALQKSKVFQPNVHNLPVAGVDDLDEDQVTSLHRDAAVNNLRFLNIFYGYRSSTFALAVNFLDRLLGKVKVRLLNFRFLHPVLYSLGCGSFLVHPCLYILC